MRSFGDLAQGSSRGAVDVLWCVLDVIFKFYGAGALGKCSRNCAFQLVMVGSLSDVL